jgi:hypothetical protein
MRMSDLPLHVLQRIESKWSAHVKRMDQQRDRKPPQGAVDGSEARPPVGRDGDEACMPKGVGGA